MLTSPLPRLGLSLAGFVTAGLLATTAYADSSVYVTNNTPKPIKLDIKSTLPSKYWKKKATVIPPFSRREIFETNRDQGVKSGKTYVFTAKVLPKDAKTGAAGKQYTQPFEIKLKLKGSTVGSHMWQSYNSQVDSHGSWHDDRKKYGTKMRVDGRHWNVTYWAYFTGGDDDVEYVFRENYKKPEGFGKKLTGEWKASHLNVLSYNAYLRPTSMFKNGQMQRAEMIPGQLTGYDVVVFQEAFDDDARAVLINGMKSKGYKYVSKILGNDEGVEQDGGVIIVSRHPIVKQAQIEFKDCDGSDCLAEKGVVYVKVNKKIGGKNNYFHVFGTHLQTGGAPHVQNKQLNQMRKFIDSRKISKSEGVLIAGDMNIDMYNKGRFNTMLNKLNAGYFTGSQIRGHKPAGKDITHDGPINDLGDGSVSYLDYVLYSKGHRKPTSASFAETRVPRALMEWKEFEHEKAMWDLSDHYAVYGNYHFANNMLDDWDPYGGNPPSGPGDPFQLCNKDSDCPAGLTCQKNTTGAKAVPPKKKTAAVTKTKPAKSTKAMKPVKKATVGRVKPITKKKTTIGKASALGDKKMYSGVCKIPPPK